MRQRVALITGAAGQDGILLSELLANEHDYEVWALVRGRSQQTRILEARVPDIQLLYGDVREKDDVVSAIEASEPTEVYNLAAFSSVARSWDYVREVMDINSLGVVNLLESIRSYSDRTGTQPKFYQASSSEMFGAPSEAPQTETTALHPRSPYGVSKSAAHLLTINYRESYGMFACSGILYNHESSLRGSQFVTAKVARAAAAIALGMEQRVTLGRIDVSRDWGYAPDYVRGMWLMMQQPEPRDYVVATGVTHTLADFIATAFAWAGLDHWRPYVTHDESLERPAEVANLVGDATKAREVLGWSPSVGFEEMVGIMVDHHLRELSSDDPVESRAQK